MATTATANASVPYRQPRTTPAGTSTANQYGIRFIPIATTNWVRMEGDDVHPENQPWTLLAVSANNRAGLYQRDPGVLEWLKLRQPVVRSWC